LKLIDASIRQVAREAIADFGYGPRIILLYRDALSVHVIATFRGAANNVSIPDLPGLRST